MRGWRGPRYGLVNSLSCATPQLARGNETVNCKKGKSKVRARPGRYRCGKCGAVSKKKDNLCEPKKIKKESAKHETGCDGA